MLKGGVNTRSKSISASAGRTSVTGEPLKGAHVPSISREPGTILWTGAAGSGMYTVWPGIATATRGSKELLLTP
jgi:hypothetical protein